MEPLEVVTVTYSHGDGYVAKLGTNVEPVETGEAFTPAMGAACLSALMRLFIDGMGMDGMQFMAALQQELTRGSEDDAGSE